MLRRLFFSCVTSSLLFAAEGDLQKLYAKLDSHSVSKQLAFAKLYPDSQAGRAARKKAWFLLSGLDQEPPLAIDELIFEKNSLLLFDSERSQLLEFPENSLRLIEGLSTQLANHHLKGRNIKSLQDFFMLEESEVDLARALFLAFGMEPEKIRHYEAYLDLMALQIRAKLGKEASAVDLIDAINTFVFEEKRFLFPPLSIFEQQIDKFTFLDAVLERGKGVCLGISTLYLCLAQRLDQRLKSGLKIFTPPGHIYLAYEEDGELLNIETTKRGVHIPSEQYLRIDLKFVPKRSLKEIPGFHFFNQAGLFWQKGEYEKALEAYEKALLYLPDDPLSEQYLAYCLLSLGKKKLSFEKLAKIRPLNYLIYQDSDPQDLLNEYCSIEDIEELQRSKQDSLQELLEQEKSLQEMIKRRPKFRSAHFHLGLNYLQTHRFGDAREALQKYHTLDPKNPLVEYYLALLYKEAFLYEKAWQHCKNTEALMIQASKDCPKSLRYLKRELAFLYPDHN